MIDDVEKLLCDLGELTGKPQEQKSLQQIMDERKCLRNIYRPWRGTKQDVRIPDLKAETVIDADEEHIQENKKCPEEVMAVPKTSASKDDSLDRVISGLTSTGSDRHRSVVDIPARQKPEVDTYRPMKDSNFSGFSFYDISRLFRAPVTDPATDSVIELIGGEDISVVSALCYIYGINFGIEGASGSGKTLAMEIWKSLLDPKEIITFKQATERAVHNLAEELNTKSWAHFPEIQKIAAGNGKGKPIIELLKDLAEGRESLFTYYVSRNKSETVRIQPLNISYTRATENSWVPDREFCRRFVEVTTNSSLEHTKKVNEKILENWIRFEHYDVEQKERNRQLKDHIRHVSKLGNIRYVDPFAFEFGKRIEKIPNSNCFVPQYGSLLRASAKFHINDRLKFRYSKDTHVVLELEDHYQVSEVYHRHFLDRMERWNSSGDIIVQPMDWGEYFRSGMDIMRSSPHLERLRKKDPGFTDRWIEKQLTGCRVMTRDYMTGEAKAICDYNGS